MFFRSLKIFVILTLFFFGSYCLVAAAEDTFNTDLTVYYTFNKEGKSTVKEQYTVTNLTSRYLISSYEYQVTGNVPGNLTARDSRGPLLIQTQKIDNDRTLIRILLNDVVAGKNRIVNFSLLHDGPDADLIDNNRKILFNGISNPSGINNFQFILSVPSDFGNLIYSSADFTSSLQVNSGRDTVYTFSGENILNQGISAIFGNSQIKKYVLKYHLSNSGDIDRKINLYLPPMASYQKIYIKSIRPEPENVTVSDTGNWLAAYQIKPHTNMDVDVIGQVMMSESASGLTFYLNKPSDLSESELPVKSELFPDVYLEPKNNLSINWIPPIQYWPFLKNTGYLEIKNVGLGAVNGISVSLTSLGFGISSPVNYIYLLPPYGHITIPVSINIGISDLFRSKYLTVNTGINTVTYNIPYNLFFSLYGLFTFISAVCFLGAAAFTHYAWGLYLQKQRRSGNLRR